MKSTYTEPVLEIIAFAAEDVITTSVPDTDPSNGDTTVL